MSTDFFDPHQPAFWRGLIISSVLLSAALILICCFSGLVFLNALTLLLIFPVISGMAFLSALLWVKLEKAFENLKWRFTHSSGIGMGFRGATQTLPVRKNTAPEAMPAEQHPLLGAEQETRKTNSSPISSVNSTEESTWFDTNYSHPCKKISTHHEKESVHENQTTTPSIFRFW